MNVKCSELVETIIAVTGDGVHNKREFLGELNNCDLPWEDKIRKQE
jgi:hypothetical protein